MNYRHPRFPLLFPFLVIGLLGASLGCIQIETTGMPGPITLGAVPELSGDVTFSLDLRSDGDYDVYGHLAGALFSDACEDLGFLANIGDQPLNTTAGGMQANLLLPGERCQNPSFRSGSQSPLSGGGTLGDLEISIEGGAEEVTVVLPPLSARDQPIFVNFEADKQSSLLPAGENGVAAVQTWNRQENLTLMIPDLANEGREIRILLDRLMLVDAEEGNTAGIRVESGTRSLGGETLDVAEASPENFMVNTMAVSFDVNTFANVDGDTLSLDLNQLGDEYGLFHIQVEIIDDLDLTCSGGLLCDGRLSRVSEPVMVELARVGEEGVCFGACG